MNDMINKNFFLFVTTFFAVFVHLNLLETVEPVVYDLITNQTCDALNPCPAWQECYQFPGIGLRCAEPDPCSYYGCPQGKQCLLLESYPAQIRCS
ncbi:MAG: hypothetical protein GOU99_03860 [Candidatus Altiarchaeota archaeon]|nr:hypothetical protein [Candidatus Altiarchaeota archaeon]